MGPGRPPEGKRRGSLAWRRGRRHEEKPTERARGSQAQRTAPDGGTGRGRTFPGLPDFRARGQPGSEGTGGGTGLLEALLASVPLIWGGAAARCLSATPGAQGCRFRHCVLRRGERPSAVGRQLRPSPRSAFPTGMRGIRRRAVGRAPVGEAGLTGPLGCAADGGGQEEAAPLVNAPLRWREASTASWFLGLAARVRGQQKRPRPGVGALGLGRGEQQVEWSRAARRSLQEGEELGRARRGSERVSGGGTCLQAASVWGPGWKPGLGDGVRP